MVTAVLRVAGRRQLTATLVQEVKDACARSEEACAPLLVDAAGGAAGAWPGECVDSGLVRKWEAAVRRLERVPGATVCVASGAMSGAPAELLLATDYRIVTNDWELRWEGWPGMGIYRLAAAVGPVRARAVAVLGRPVGANEALAWGLVHEVAPGEPEARARAEAVASAAPVGPAAGIARQLVLEALVTDPETALGSHLAACARMLRDTVEGIAS